MRSGLRLAVALLANHARPRDFAAAFSASPGWGVLILIFGGLRSVTAGLILVVVGSLWFIAAGFAESPWWGIALLLFNGIAGMLFLLFCWERTRRPSLTYLVGIGLLLVAVYVKP